MGTRCARRWLVLVLLGLPLTGCLRDGGGGGSRSVAPGSQPPTAYTPRTSTATVVASWGEGFLEDDGGRRIIHLKGDPYEMGYQYGFLLGPEIEALDQCLTDWLQQQSLPAILLPAAPPAAAFLFRGSFPPDVLDELRGMLDGMRQRNPGTWITEDDLIFMNSLVDLGGVLDLQSFRCSGMTVWGPRTVGGGTFQTRNIDLMVGTGLENYAVVAVFKREGRVPYASATWAGWLGVVSGLNAHGVGISQVWGYSTDKAFGEPWPLTVRRVLEEAVSTDDALRIFQQVPLRTYGANFVFGDRGDGRPAGPSGLALESTAHYLASFRADDPREDLAVFGGVPYSIRMPFAVFRADVVMDPFLRSLQTGANGPTGDPRTTGGYVNRYQGQADRIRDYEQRGVLIGAPEAQEISRGVAMAGASLQCCVYDNTNVKMWVANAAIRSGQAIDANVLPYYPYDIDFYLPTFAAAPVQASYRVGDPIALDLDWSNPGRERRLDVRVRALPAGGGAVSFPAPAAPIAVGAGQSGRTTVVIPAPTGVAGLMEIEVGLYEAGTPHLVDLARTTVSIW